MPVRLGLNVGGLLTAEITTASTLKTMSTRKAKLHMDVQAIIYLCVATMNQFTAAGTLAVIFYRRRRGPTFARSQNDPARPWFFA
jgi:hypothetical protein